MTSLFDQVWNKRYSFLGTFFLVFTLSYVVLLAFDFLPEPQVTTTTNESVSEESAVNEGTTEVDISTTTVAASALATEPVAVVEEITSVETAVVEPVAETDISALPVSLTIEKLGKTVTVLNPTSRNISDLNTALLDGVVRHPDSATLSQDGNVFILGHSSYLPVVINKNFQAFNGIQNLEWGDVIEVSSADMVYKYRVEKVYRTKAGDATVPIAGTEKLLTLATCNSFGSVDDRYVVEARRIGEYHL